MFDKTLHVLKKQEIKNNEKYYYISIDDWKKTIIK